MTMAMAATAAPSKDVVLPPKNKSSQDGTGVIQLDPWLEPYKAGLVKRLDVGSKRTDLDK